MRLRRALESAVSSQRSSYDDVYNQFNKVYRAGNELAELLREVRSGNEPDTREVKRAISAWQDV